MIDRPPTWLLDFKADVHSQAGEDGVLGKILELLPAADRWCVEFGAWDGAYFSNTRHLIESRGYSAVLIEPDPGRYAGLCRNYREVPRVIPVNRAVGFTPADGLDTILRGTPVPTDFDLLSIDIDGNDYHAWEAVTYRPKVVCVEFNPTIPTGVRFVQPADPRIAQGTGITPLAELGKAKGYELVAVLDFNAVFVRAEYFPLFGIRDNRPDALRTCHAYVTHLFTGYDGTVFLAGNRRLVWHDLPLEAGRMQLLPRWLRAYPAHYGPVRRRLVAALRWLRGAGGPG